MRARTLGWLLATLVALVGCVPEAPTELLLEFSSHFDPGAMQRFHLSVLRGEETLWSAVLELHRESPPGRLLVTAEDPFEARTVTVRVAVVGSDVPIVSQVQLPFTPHARTVHQLVLGPDQRLVVP
jgi:hypothetical protein